MKQWREKKKLPHNLARSHTLIILPQKKDPPTSLKKLVNEETGGRGKEVFRFLHRDGNHNSLTGHDMRCSWM